METALLTLLEQLVECDTQNPPREITADHPIFQVILDALPAGFTSKKVDLGEGRVWLLVERGTSPLLFNVHLDTVPCGDGWDTDPLKLHIADGRAYGRGACDIKGAAAAMIVTAHQTDADMSILFSSDEEGSGSYCIQSFCTSDSVKPYEIVLVAEPTGCQAVFEHRGYMSVYGRAAGNAGHSSRADLLPHSANHRAIQWAHDALQYVQRLEDTQLDGVSACFNIGRLDGGTKNNVIAHECELSWSMRLPPMQDVAAIEKQILSDWSNDNIQWDVGLNAPPLPHRQDLKEAAKAFCKRSGIDMANAVEFWTEAALFSQSGLPAFVLGPGDIAQAHTANEWVAVNQLELAVSRYVHVAKFVRDHGWNATSP